MIDLYDTYSFLGASSATIIDLKMDLSQNLEKDLNT